MEDFYLNLVKLYELIGSGKSIDDVLHCAFESFKKFIPYDRIGLALLDSDSNIYAFDLKSSYDTSLKSGYSLGIQQTSLKNVINNKKPRIIKDYKKYLEENPKSEPTKLIVEEGIRSSVTLPLITNGICVGVLFFSSREVDAYSDDYVNMIKAIGNNVAMTIEKDLLVDDLILSSIVGLAKLVEAKDSETGIHVERMQNYSRVIAKTLAKKEKYKNIINYKYIEDIYKFSPLHDIGKVGIADGILLKPAKLTPQEFEVMKSHTTIGAEVLKKASNNHLRKGRHFFDMGIEIALHHHEKYNGEGYPYGLKGEAIPLSARIVMAADVLDALISKRVYKNAVDIDYALKMIEDEKGKMFDPDVIDALFESKDEIVEIYEKFKEDFDWSR